MDHRYLEILLGGVKVHRECVKNEHILYVFVPTAVLMVPDAAKMVELSLSFHSSTLLFMNVSNSLEKVFGWSNSLECSSK